MIERLRLRELIHPARVSTARWADIVLWGDAARHG